MERKFIYDDQGDIRRTLIVDEEKPYSPVVKTSLVMDDILDSVQRDRDNIRPNSTNKLVARVPMTIYEQSIHEGWDEDKWKQWLNDPDNAAFRVWEGKV